MEISGEYSVCVECYMLEATGDASELSYHYPEREAATRLQEIESGFKELTKEGGHLATGENLADFAKSPCECCGTALAGSRHGLFVIK